MGMVYFGVRGKGCTQWGLLVSSGDPLSSTNYPTISYRWGSSQTLLLTRKAVAGFRCGRPIHALPQTFKDPVAIARYFSIRYIWVDAL